MRGARGRRATFLTRVPGESDTEGQDYWVLDDDTPTLPELIALLADALEVRSPRVRVPVSVLRALPGLLTGADPEALSSSVRTATDGAGPVAGRALGSRVFAGG